MNPTYMTTAEVAAELRVSDRTVRDWIRRGLLASTKIGGRRLITSEEVSRVGRSANPAETG